MNSFTMNPRSSHKTQISFAVPNLEYVYILIYIYISQQPKGLEGGETLPLLICFQME